MNKSELNRALNESAGAACIQVYARINLGEDSQLVLDELWNEFIYYLDEDQQFELGGTKDVWQADVKRRARIIGLVTQPDGIERIMQESITAFCRFMNTKSSVNILKAFYGNTTLNSRLIQKIDRVSANSVKYYLHTSSIQQLRAATAILEYARKAYSHEVGL